MSAFDVVVALAVGYLLGGIPSAALAARRRGQTIFTLGSGNMGAMNTARNLGVGWGVAVLLSDIGKGALAVLAGGAIAGAVGAGAGAELGLGLSAGVAAVFGHAWSPYVGFRGGKALATAFGAALVLTPWAGLAALTLVVALVLLLRNVALATILTLLAYPLTTYLAVMRSAGDQDLAFAATTAAAAAALVMLVKHATIWLAQRRGRSDPS